MIHLKKYLLLFCACMLVSWFLKNLYDTHIYKNDVYVYADFETGPGLLEMVEFIKAPKKVRKIIAWAPWQNLGKRIDLTVFNAREITYNPKPNEQYYYYIMNQLMKELADEVKDNPHVQITLYTNLEYIEDMLDNLRRVISDRNIKHIHLYEKGFGQTVAQNKEQILKHTFSKGPPLQKSHPATPFYTHEMFPTTYHLGYVSEIRKNQHFKGFLNLMNNAQLQNVDYQKIAKSLSARDKKKLALLLNIEPDTYSKAYQLTKKKTAFLIGPKPGEKKQTEAQIFVLSELLSAHDYFWFFKPHPHDDVEIITKRLKKQFPHMLVIPQNIPIEAFLFLDILPDYVGGYSSSAFFTLNNELFLFYIKRPHDNYLPFLLKQGILNQSQTLKLRSP